MQHPINRPIWPVISDEIFTDREDLLALLKLRAMNTRFQRTMSFALLGHRRVGKTEVLKRLYNDLFWEQSEVVPIYITYDKLDRQADRFAKEYFFQFLRQYIAFKKKDSALAMSDVDPIDLAKALIHETPNEGLQFVLRNYLGTIEIDTVGFRLNAVLHAPRAVAEQNEEPILMILDEFQHVITRGVRKLSWVRRRTVREISHDAL
ncbi:AAA family ATPase [Candidatus Poribacteria bacterium]|nr:AAA family ATPase [Candidatus Poribacteria bacterium]